MTESGKGERVQHGAEEAEADARVEEAGADAGIEASVGVGPAATRPASDEHLEPLSWSTGRIVLGGIALWAVALVVTLLVPALHTGDRSWWPWTCAAGIALGLLGYAYVRRGRGNARGTN